MSIREIIAGLSTSDLKDDEFREIMEKKEISMKRFLELVHREAWEEDAMFEKVGNADGGVDIEEHIWSLNHESTHVLVSINGEGLITKTSGLSVAEVFQKHGVHVTF